MPMVKTNRAVVKPKATGAPKAARSVTAAPGAPAPPKNAAAERAVCSLEAREISPTTASDPATTHCAAVATDSMTAAVDSTARTDAPLVSGAKAAKRAAGAGSTTSSTNSIGLTGEEEHDGVSSARSTSVKDHEDRHNCSERPAAETVPSGSESGDRAAAAVAGSAIAPAAMSRGTDGGAPVLSKCAGNCNLFIRGLPASMTQEELDAHFAPFGTILSSAIMRNILTGESLRTAFVRFETHEEAAAAMRGLHGACLDGSVVSIQWARKQDGAPVGEARRKIMKLFVRNIPSSITTEELTALFAPYGRINTVTLHKDTAAAAVGHGGALLSGDRPAAAATRIAALMDRLIAFVTYDEEGAAEKAAPAVHNTKPFEACNGIPLMVKLAEDIPSRAERQHNQQLSQQHRGGHPGHAARAGGAAAGGNSAYGHFLGAPSSDFTSPAASMLSLGAAPDRGDRVAGVGTGIGAHPSSRRDSQYMDAGHHMMSAAGLTYNSFPNNLMANQAMVTAAKSLALGFYGHLTQQHQQQQQQESSSPLPPASGGCGSPTHAAGLGASVMLGRSAPSMPSVPPSTRPFNAPPPQHQLHVPPAMVSRGSWAAAHPESVTPAGIVPYAGPPLCPHGNSPMGGFVAGDHGSVTSSGTNLSRRGPSCPVTPHIYNTVSAAAYAGAGVTDLSGLLPPPQQQLDPHRVFPLPAPRSFQIKAESSFVLKHLGQASGRMPETAASAFAAPPFPHSADAPATIALPAHGGSSCTSEGADAYEGLDTTGEAAASMPHVHPYHRSVLSNPALVLQARTAMIAPAAALSGSASQLNAQRADRPLPVAGAIRVYRHNPYACLIGEAVAS